MHLKCGQPDDSHTARLIDKTNLKGPLSAHITNLYVHPWVFDAKVIRLIPGRCIWTVALMGTMHRGTLDVCSS